MRIENQLGQSVEPQNPVVLEKTPTAMSAGADRSHTATSRPYPYQNELEEVERFIAQSQFGVVGEEIRHFTHQIKSDSRRFFPDEQFTYQIADDMQNSAIFRVVAMRFITLLTFICYTIACLNIFQAPNGTTFASPELFNWFGTAKDALIKLKLSIPSDASASQFGDVFLAAIFYFIARIVVRTGVLFLVVQPYVLVARANLKAAHTKLVNECRNVASTMSVIENAETWPDWAGKSSMVALWYAMRADYVDRYSTTCLWKIRRSFEVWEWGFRIAKIILACVAIWVVWRPLNQAPDTELQVSFVSYLLFGFLGWDYLGRAPNNFLGILFNQGDTESARTHYFRAFSTHIKNLATMALTMRH